MVLAPGRDLADEHRADHAAVGAEHHGREVLGRRPRGARAAPSSRAANAGALPRSARSGDDGRGLRAHGRDPLARDELDEVAPVRADVGERARRAAPRRVDAPVVVLGRRQPVLQVAAVDEADRADPARRDPRPGLERPSGCSGRRTARSRRGPARSAASSSARRPRRRSSRAASRRRRACRPASAAVGERRVQVGSACRCGRRRRRRRRRPPRTSRTRADAQAGPPPRARARRSTRPRRRPRPRPGARSARGRGR